MSGARPPLTWRVEICGGVASGKTTLALLLARGGLSPVFEAFRRNPFWRGFYADPVGAAFETEVTFLLQHYHQIHRAVTSKDGLACDFSLVLDEAYAYTTLDRRSRRVFDVVLQECRWRVGRPDLLIHLSCDPQIELARIGKRGRAVEQSVQISFLRKLNRALERVVGDLPRTQRVLKIDSAVQDFARDRITRRHLLGRVLRSLRE